MPRSARSSSPPGSGEAGETPDARADELDVLRTIADDARVSNSNLAKALGIPASTSLYRLQRLQDRGVITGFHASVDHRALGMTLSVLITVALVDQRPERRRSFLARVADIPQVLSIMRVSGTDGFVLHVVARSSDELLLEVVEPLSAMSEVRHTDSRMVGESWERSSMLGGLRRTFGPPDTD